VGLVRQMKTIIGVQVMDKLTLEELRKKVSEHFELYESYKKLLDATEQAEKAKQEISRIEKEKEKGNGKLKKSIEESSVPVVSLNRNDSCDYSDYSTTIGLCTKVTVYSKKHKIKGGYKPVRKAQVFIKVPGSNDTRTKVFEPKDLDHEKEFERLNNKPILFAYKKGKRHEAKNIHDVATNISGGWKSLYKPGFSYAIKATEPVSFVQVGNSADLNPTIHVRGRGRVSSVDKIKRFRKNLDDNIDSAMKPAGFIKQQIGEVSLQSSYLPFGKAEFIWRYNLSPQEWKDAHKRALLLYNDGRGRMSSFINVKVGQFGEIIVPKFVNAIYSVVGIDEAIDIQAKRFYRNGDGCIDFVTANKSFDVKTRNGGKNWSINTTRKVVADYLVQVVCGNDIDIGTLQKEVVNSHFVMYLVGCVSNEEYHRKVRSMGGKMYCDHLNPPNKFADILLENKLEELS